MSQALMSCDLRVHQIRSYVGIQGRERRMNHAINCQSTVTTCELMTVQSTYPYAALLGADRYKRKRRLIMTQAAAIDPSSSSGSDSSRPLANFPSNVWGYHFLSYTSELTEITTQEKLELEELKEKVRKMLVDTPDNSTQKLVLIDTIQRLGVAYHFSNEIETSIQNIFDASQQSENINNDDNLYVVALRFRLVRQQGHYMSPDVFKKFTGHDGKFKESLTNDVQGLLSLYEAAHFRVHEEEILEEAITFTTTHLESIVPNLTNSLKVQVTEALIYPVRKATPRVVARKYISIYEDIDLHNELLLKFAKLDFNAVQKLHQSELRELTRWWKDLDFANKYPYARNRLVEVYFWMLGVYYEPQYSRARKFLTKVIKIDSILDDTYDAYGTLDELVPFTDAIERWDISEIDSLQPYQRPAYQALLDIYGEMEEQLVNECKSDRVYYAKKEMQKLVRAFLKEAQWLNAGYTPTCEEYTKNALVSCGYMMGATTSLVGMEDFISQENFEWITNEPLIVLAASVINRAMCDMTGHEVEQQRAHIASFIECYMKEYGASKEEAYVKLQKDITNAWKDINKELLRPKEVPMFVLERVLNCARSMDTMYKEGDGYTDSKRNIKNMVNLLLVEPIKI
ncbi:PREDICTED: germacrene C synthase-like [Nicotiana attenuata]|uniref:Germacrene c synthase n=1 Tax=Nicotiana attenuata TaxID=49451 RepID=A0A314L3C1_NICAT|nr:PREDICTED: germacrene C synthase-like [Nicotiana attenuata]OIT36063.1 germacrene c synthase [Nicotiana attenuata]